ncbi:MAG TPA: formate dehydrogenase accessory sulfurtransferase FdhD [Vicinamibacterales bacterium]
MELTRPRIGISACLLGEEVRYDGGHKRDPLLTDVLGPRVEWVPVCPEVEMGLGTPRETLKLVRVEGSRALRMITTLTGIDHTDGMNRWAKQRLDELAREELSGYILKKDSPSCGVEDVKTFGADGPPERNGRGLFAAALMERFPSLPVEDEGRLADTKVLQDFIARVFAYREKLAVRSSRSAGLGAEPPQGQYRTVSVIHVGRAGRAADGPSDDLAAVEEPLEVRLHGKPFAVIMRTPGEDRALAVGFLLSEGVVRSADDLGAVEHCRHPDYPDRHNVVDVFLLGDARDALDNRTGEAEWRNVMTNSSCGLCGRVTIESLRTRAMPLASTWTMSKTVAASLPDLLRARQTVFTGTGGLHAAGLFTPEGNCAASAEDVGRHNAVDKVVGAMLLEERLPLDRFALAVSGRASFEIVQKAWIAGIGLVCAVSAPSSLAIDLASEAGITLLGFAREGGFNVYTHPSRIVDLNG